jgi:uncharacterized membrane protein
MLGLLIQKAYAYTGETTTGGSSFDSLFQKITTNIVSPIIYLLMAAAIVYFIWGVFMFIKNADNSEKRKEGYQHMIWGIIGLFIMFSVRGIINVILSTMGLN